MAQFATLDWFVNGTTGSDTANNGRTASTAFKTIQHAIDCAAPEEQIFVAAGTYAPIDASRANVAIIGDGRDTTIIDGGGTTRCADLGERNFSYLQGFTLRNGRHMNVGTNPGHGEEGVGDPVLAANALRQAAEAIGRIVGKTYSDDLLDELFSRFCVGK